MWQGGQHKVMMKVRNSKHSRFTLRDTGPSDKPHHHVDHVITRDGTKIIRLGLLPKTSACVNMDVQRPILGHRQALQ